MKKIMNFFMLSCKRATELMSKKEVLKLSIIEVIQLKVHKSMCKACAAYEKQSIIIENILSKSNDESLVDKQELTKVFKNELLKKIKEIKK